MANDKNPGGLALSGERQQKEDGGKKEGFHKLSF